MRRRRTDWGSLIAGLCFVALGAAFLLHDGAGWSVDLVWALPALAVGLGLAGIARAMVRARDRRDAGDADRG
ncbi:hypothetical protein [Nocardiopsis halophila]|uniref:hypothetical protein n=1 Tax=Nocardiopsis halophila TaxID=141692 RepID=UPI000348EE17|nr:hypothetical protein [Nocardiopsis halophila]